MLLRVIQERHDLCTGAGILWREGCLLTDVELVAELKKDNPEWFE